jgi:hypothetical protein
VRAPFCNAETGGHIVTLVVEAVGEQIKDDV